MEEKLIMTVETFPCLYDKDFPEYRNLVKKEKAWLAVSEIVKQPSK